MSTIPWLGGVRSLAFGGETRIHERTPPNCGRVSVGLVFQPNVCPSAKALKRADQIRADWAQASIEEQRDLLRSTVDRIVLKPGSLIIILNRAGLANILADQRTGNPHPVASSIISIELPISLRRKGVETRIVLTDGHQQTEPDAALIQLLIRAHRYLHQLTGCLLEHVRPDYPIMLAIVDLIAMPDLADIDRVRERW